MSRLTKSAILGLLIGIIGVVVGLFPFGLNLEENVGLDLLFKLRGVRQSPSEVIIVSIDKESAHNLNLPEDPEEWPRSVHARLIENLVREGAEIIAFDMRFEEASTIKEDKRFAEAMRKARNVILCKCIISEMVITVKGESAKGVHQIVRIIPPIHLFSQSAVAIAPFPLPKVPVKVSQYWTFKTGAGSMPTLPIVVFQLFTMQVYDEFIQLMEKVSPYQAKKLPRDSNAIITSRNVGGLIRSIREIFTKEPQIAERMLKELESSAILADDTKRYQMLKSLIKMYQGADSQYLNFYGPPYTIRTAPYYQALQLREGEVDNTQIDVKGKAIFVGFSELLQPVKKDGYYTVFSQKGIDISGVEIAATAFANLLEDMHVKQPTFITYVAIIIFWGTLIGILCRFFSTGLAALSVIGLGVLYLIFAEYQFKTNSIWYPLIIPLFLQTPLAFFVALLWNYIETNKERQNIREAFGYYLPNNVVDQLAKNIANIRTSNQVVYGICLATDAEQYTSLSETMDPKELGSFMNRYYETVFKPIRQHGGIVSDVVGDSVLALWISPNPETVFMNKACLAALDITKAVYQFNQSSDIQLQIRIGLHFGQLLLGHIGAMDHYEYRPVGDIVNTATRIEGLNKYLGTRTLVSKEITYKLDGFLTREIGKFRLAGKVKTIVIYELISLMDEANVKQIDAYTSFAEALNVFRRQLWDEAIEKFHAIIKSLEEDGPSQFYIRLCEHYKENAPEEPWDGVVHMEKK